MSSATKVVVIHGVGSPAPGSAIRALSGAGEGSSGATYAESTVVAGGCRYTILKPLTGSGLEMIEVNWADVRRPLSKLRGLLTHFGLLNLAMLRVAADPRRPGQRPHRLLGGEIHRLFVEWVLLWAALLPAFSLLASRLEDPDGRAALWLIPLGLAVISYSFRSVEPHVWVAGTIWAIGYGLAGALRVCGALESDHLVFFAARIYSAAQQITGWTLTIALLHIAGSRHERGQPWTVRLSRFGLMYTPVIAISCAGPLTVVAVGAHVPRAAADDWNGVFKRGLGYSLASAEAVMTICVAAIGVGALAGVLWYLAVGGPGRGARARAWMVFLVWGTPVVLLANGVLFAVEQRSPWLPVQDAHALDIYWWSAARVVPFVPFLVGPLTVLLDVAGDVVFYLLPETHALSTSGETRRRLRVIMEGVAPDDTVVVLAHSQGSVIAADVMEDLVRRVPARGATIRLVTMGSPIDTLYRRLLGIAIGADLRATAGFGWENLSRWGDPIGGPIERVRHRDLGDGGHVGYWTDDTIGEYARRP
jgi:hypothetical protein